MTSWEVAATNVDLDFDSAIFFFGLPKEPFWNGA